MRPPPLLALAALGALSAVVRADQRLVRITAFPNIALADGRSQITINAEVRDTAGRLVPDGTRVVLATTLGYFRENIVTTSGGLARGNLTAGGIPGIAKITAQVLGDASVPSVLEYEFVADKKLLASAQEYVEVYAGEQLEYTYDTQILDAAGVGRKAKLRYRDLTIEADDIQYSVSAGEVRARNALVRYGKKGKAQGFSEFYTRLSSRKGFGVAPVRTRRWETVVPNGRDGFAFVREKLDAEGNSVGYELPPETETLGILEISSAGTRPGTNPMGERAFAFADLSESLSSVTAKRATIVPRRLINFQRADLRVSGQRIMSAPLYQLPLTQSSSPIITEQIVNMNDNQLAVNYPYYLSLGANSSSLLRFRTGQSYGRTTAVNRGAYLDYELNWNRGDEATGGLHMTGLARSDWSIGANQFLRVDSRTTANAQVEVPAGRSLFGSANVSRGFDGFQTTLAGNVSQALRGPKLSSRDLTFVAEKDPIPVANAPFDLFLGLTANDSTIENSFVSRRQTTTGARLRAQSHPIRLDGASTLTTSLTVNRYVGEVSGYPTTVFATTTLSRNLGSGASLLGTYDFAADGFNDALLGRHRLSMQGSLNRGSTNFTLFASRSLDLDRQSLYADGSYRLAKMWRLGSSYTYDGYLGSSFSDYNVFLGYRVGFREIGLVYSRRTGRVGIQLLSVPVGF